MIEGPVRVDPSAEVVNSVITGPAVIGSRCRIVNSRIGPGTSIYHGARVIGSDIAHAIVLEDARIDGFPAPIRDSIIGRSARLTSASDPAGALSMELGDYSRLSLGTEGG